MNFTQFMRPNGRRVQRTVDRPEEIESLADDCVKRGVRFECEVLNGGQVSFTAELDDDPIHGEVTVLGHELVKNGPGVLDAVDRLVRIASQRLVEAG